MQMFESSKNYHYLYFLRYGFAEFCLIEEDGLLIKDYAFDFDNNFFKSLHELWHDIGNIEKFDKKILTIFERPHMNYP